MDQQKKCLSGMANGLPVAVPVSPANPLVIHTLPAAAKAGEAFLDQFELFLANNDPVLPARLSLTFVSPSNVVLATQTYDIPSGAKEQIIEETPFGGAQSGLGGATIRVQLAAGAGLSAAATAWGWVFTSRG